MRPRLLASISGMLYALITELPLLALAPPVPPSGAQDVVDYYIRNQAGLRVMRLLRSIGAILLLVFLAGLSAHLGNPDRRHALLTMGLVTAGLVVAAMTLVTSATTLSIVLNVGRADGSAAVQLLNDFTNATEVLMSLPLAAVVALTSVILLRNQHAIRWIGLVGLPVAALLSFRTAAVVGGPELPFPPLYSTWFKVLAIGIAVRELRAGRRSACADRAPFI